ncbi:malonyl CoA-acyl carrier protein transacylase [Clostridiales bacterium]|nr:malonyl CoA-acyl carrier protein transacylase [Clostridiales bacterium]
MKIGLLFPGQGAQYAGMGYFLYQAEPAAKRIFDEISEICKVDTARLCFSKSEDELKKTENAQLAIFTVSMANYYYCVQYINEPYVLAGHSLGEISALTAAGALSLCDAARMVYQRGLLMGKIIDYKDKYFGKMHAVVGLRTHIVEEIINRMDNKAVQIACYNTPNQTIVAGPLDELMLVDEEAKKFGANIIELPTAGPFHTSLMNDVGDEFTAVLQELNISMPKYDVISSVNGKLYTDTTSIKENLNKQFSTPVRWEQCVSKIIDKHPDLIVDMGPGKVMESMIKWTGLKFYTVEENLDSIKNFKTEEIIHTLKRYMGIAVCTPNKNLDMDAYFAGVIKPYQEIQTMVSNIVSNKETNGNEIAEALRLLRQIFRAKKIADKEQKERFVQLRDETGWDEIINNFIDKNYKS